MSSLFQITDLTSNLTDSFFPNAVLVVKSGNEQRAVLENEKIERYIMKNIPGGHLLFVKDVETAKLIENLYSVSLRQVACGRFSFGQKKAFLERRH